jgi:hypothetical protein
MARVLRVQRGRKAEIMKGQDAAEAMAGLPIGGTLSALVAFIQSLLPLGVRAVTAALEPEVTQLAGPRYSRTGGHPDYARGGEPGGLRRELSRTARSTCSTRSSPSRSRASGTSGRTRLRRELSRAASS